MITVDTNAKKVIDRFKEMSFREQTKAMKKGFRKGFALIRNDAKKNLKKEVSVSGSDKYSDTLTDAILISFKDKGKQNVMNGKVHVLGNRKPKSGTFRTRFFETGTKERKQKERNGKKLKKEINLKRIKPVHFFEDAIRANESKIDKAINDELQRTIIRINNGK